MRKKTQISKSEITPEGFVVTDGMVFAYVLKVTPDGRDCHIYLRRDFANQIDIIISDYGDGFFTFARDGTEGFPLSMYKELGYKTCSESDFNDMYIEAVRYINHKKPQRKRK